LIRWVQSVQQLEPRQVQWQEEPYLGNDYADQSAVIGGALGGLGGALGGLGGALLPFKTGGRINQK